MMEPTREYLAAPEVSRSRIEASNGEVHVALENFHDAANRDGKSTVYLSVDNGKTFTLLDWKASWSSWWKLQGRAWPPHGLYIDRLDDDGLHVKYFDFEASDDEMVKASYLFADKRWRLR